MSVITNVAGVPGGAPVDPDTPREIHMERSTADRIFRVLLASTSTIVLLIIGGIVVFLVKESWQALSYSGLTFITSSKWAPQAAHPVYGVLGGLAGSVMIAVIALILALPVGVATALLINEFIPRRARRVLTALVDLLAALPSLVYGLWGLEFLTPHIQGTTIWIDHYLNFIPFLTAPNEIYGHSIFLCGIVVSVMILPIITSISREIMSQVPRENCEAALALGGTRWGMITDVIIPFGRDGILGGALLGLGRAMGETMAVLLILAPTFITPHQILGPGGTTIAQMIGNYFENAGGPEESALTLAGLTLFATTLVVNIGARRIVAHSRARA